MISVERFVQDEPVLFRASCDFVQMLQSLPDPIIAVAQKCKSQQTKIAWILLGSALFQDCSYSEIQDLIEALYRQFPEEKLWTLPVPKASDINDIVEQTFNCKHWSLYEHTAGIFWSVGLFIRRHEDLSVWIGSRTPEGLWRDLGEIYFMGKGNPRPKVCAAIYRLIAAAPMGLGIQFANSFEVLHLPPLPLTMGARRFLAILGPAKDNSFADLEPEEKQSLANSYFSKLNGDNPYMAAHSLQFFLEQGRDDFICRESTGHCQRCPLYPFCSYAEVR